MAAYYRFNCRCRGGLSVGMKRVNDIKEKYGKENDYTEDIIALLRHIKALEDDNQKLIQICNEQSRAIDTLNFENQSLLKEIMHKRWLEDVFGKP